MRTVFRKGRYKLIEGNLRDGHWYTESTADRVATTDDGYLHRVLGSYSGTVVLWLG